MGQQTLSEKVSCTGVGLHGGAPVQVTLCPARADHGVVFVRRSGGGRVEIPAHPASVRSTRFATSLGLGEATVGTVEHLLAALYGLGIDNVEIEVDGPELPVMDGSAAPFVYLIRSAGIFAQPEPRRVLRVRRRLEAREGERWIRIEPAPRFRISYAVEFAHPAIGRQELDVEAPDADAFEHELSAARTFGFLHEVEGLWRSGFARGGSLENTVVLDGERVLNPGGLRWPDEFVRHKVLDLFGDLALLGLPIRGHVRCERGGHSLHQRLVAALVREPDAWHIEAPTRAARASLPPALQPA